MTVFEAYITNLGKYAEGQLVGETLKFPATTEEVQSLLKNIGVDGVRYEEFFITTFDGDVMGLYDYLTEYENLDELNHLAHLISELDSDEIETLEAALNKGDHTSSVADIINLVHNLDCYSLHPGVTDDETLGRIYVEDMELLDVPDNVLPYFDFEAYGRDMRINEGGHFAPTGYLARSGDFKEVYHGIEDIPAEHRIFAYPKLNIREQMAAYKERRWQGRIGRQLMIIWRALRSMRRIWSGIGIRSRTVRTGSLLRDFSMGSRIMRARFMIVIRM